MWEAVAAACLVAGTLVSLQAGAETAPTFDPNAPIVLDRDGSELPDEVAVMAAFDTRHAGLDRCVAKVRHGTRTVAGSADLEVLLDPEGQRPLGVNAYLSKDAPKRPSLGECLRAEISRAPFPAYDGPPTVVAFSFELDPGMIEEEGSE